MDIVYSAYIEDFSSGDEAGLYPYWKITYSCSISDKELEKRMYYLEKGTFRNDEASEWYMLVNAYTGE